MAENEEETQKKQTSPKPELDDLDSKLDRTRMDIDFKSPTEEVTRSQIIIQEKQEEANPTAKSSFIFGSILRLFMNVFDGVKAKLPPKKTVKKKSKSSISLPVRLYPWMGSWLPSTDLSLKEQLGFYLSRLLCLCAGVLFHYLLLQSTWDAMQQETIYQYGFLAIFSIALLVSAFGLLRHRHPVWFVGSPFLGIHLLLLIHVLFFRTTDTTFFSLMNLAPAFVLNSVWFVVLAFQVVLLWILFPRSRFLKAFIILPTVYGLTGFLSNLLEKIPLEASWLGSGVFTKIPVIYAQPVFVSLHGIVFLLIIVNIFGYFFYGKKISGRPWLGLNLLILLCMSAQALFLLQKNRVPNVLNFYVKPSLGIGALEHKEGTQILEVKTSNFGRYEHLDTAERYRFQLVEIPQKQKSTTKDLKKEYQLWVSDTEGFPVFFMTKADLNVIVNNTTISSWRIKPLVDQKPAKAGSDALAASYVVSITITEDILSQKNDEGTGENSVEDKNPDEALPVKKMIVDRPLEGDAFDKELEIAVRHPNSPENDVPSLSIFLDDEKKSTKEMPPYLFMMDTSSVPDGDHILKVVDERQANSAAESDTSQIIHVRKASHPDINFSSPSFGEIVSWETPIVVASNGSPEDMESLGLFYEEKSLHQWKVPPFEWVWDTSDLPPGNVTLYVRGKTKGNLLFSNWVTFSTGAGKLVIHPPEVGATEIGEGGPIGSATQYSKVIFIMDASVSQLDPWDGMTKWEWLKKIGLNNSLQEKLIGNQVGLVLSGTNHSFIEKNCSDAQLEVPLSKFQNDKIQNSLKTKKARGVFSLYESLRLALKQNPQKIIVLADGADGCSLQAPSDLVKKLGQSKVALDMITLGELLPKEKKSLEQLVSMTSNYVIPVKNGKELQEKMIKALSRNYRIFYKDKSILEEALDGQEQDIRPGTYTLQISMDPPFAEREITIRNGLTAELFLKIEGNETIAKER